MFGVPHPVKYGGGAAAGTESSRPSPPSEVKILKPRPYALAVAAIRRR